MKLTNPSLVLEFVKSSVIPITVVTNAEIVRESIEIDSQMMNDLKSTSDKAKVTITKKSVAVSRILSFDGDIKATLKDGDTILFTGFLSNKYKWSVTNHGEQVLSLTIEDNTRLLETIFSDRDQLVKKEFYIPARSGHPVASGLLVDIANVCGLSLTASVPEISTEIIKNIPSDTACVDIMDKACFELGYCYKFDNAGKLYLWKIAKGDEAVSATLDKSNLYAVQENGVIVNKSLRQYNRAIVKYSEINSRSNALIYQDISGQDDSHPYCYIEVAPGTAYPSGLTIAGHTDDQLKAICDATDLDEGMTIIGIGDEVTTDFTCTDASIKADIRKYSATQISVLIKNTRNVPVFILKLRASASITYDEGETKIYAGSVSDTKFYEAELDYVHDNTAAAALGNLIYQFYKYSNLSYQFYSKTKLEIGDIIKLKEDVHSGIEAKLMVNARVDLSSSDIYQYVAYSFTPFNLSEPTSGSSAKGAPAVIPAKRVIIEYALSDNPYSLYSTFGLQDDSFGCGIETLFGLMNLSDWQPSVPYPIPEGKYVWMRTSSDSGKTWAYARLTGDKGEKGRDGDEKQFNLTVARQTFIQNRRLDGAQSIAVTCELIGFPTGYYTEITTLNATYSSGNLIIPYDNIFATVSVTALLYNESGELVDSKTETLTPQDETELPQFLGCLSTLPAATKSGQKIIDGDYFCVKSNFTGTDGNTYTQGECWRRNQGGWLKLNTDNGTADEMLTCLHAFKEAGIDFDSISSSSSIAWFNGIVSHSIIADTIKAKKGFFDDITIGKTASFLGTIISDPLSTNGGTTSTSTYISDSSVTGGGAFKWEEVKSYIISNKSPSAEVFYTASGKINGKTLSGYPQSKAVYLSSLGGYRNVTDGTVAETATKEVEICTATYPSKYRITASMAGGGEVISWIAYKIYSGSTVVNSGYVVKYSGGGTITTPVIQKGQVLKLAVSFCGMTYDVDEYYTDNFDTGINVICDDGTIFNLGNSGSKETITYLTGVGTDLKLVCGGITWAQCDSSAWTSGIPKYNNWAGKTSGTAGISGAGQVTSHSIYVRKSGGSTIEYHADYAVWDSNSLSLSLGGVNQLTLNTSSSNLEYWYINLEITVSTGGLITQTILPKSHLTYDLGSSNKKWRNGYFSSISASSISTDSFSADNLYGQLGASSSRSKAYVSTLYCNALSGINYLDPTTDISSSGVTGDTSSQGTLSVSLPTLGVGQMMVYTYKTRKALSVSISGGTYGIAALSVAGNQGEEYGVQRFNSASWSGSAFTLGYSASYCNSIGYLIIYWRKA